MALCVVVAVILASAGLIYTKPWSEITVRIYSAYKYPIEVNISTDGDMKAFVEVGFGSPFIGTWSVNASHHLVTVDHGTWGVWENATGIHYNPGSYRGPDGHIDYAFEYNVGPLYNKEIYIYITLPSLTVT